jgi:uncharacterized protein YbjT (DUF2867 family)
VYLVVGATGVLGSEICRLATDGGPVRALARPTSDPATVERLRVGGVETVEGDLGDPDSLGRACEGVDAVISTVSAIGRGGSFQETDVEGHRRLFTAAQSAGADHFVFVSLLKVPVRTPLVDAKRTVESFLQEADLHWTILRPSRFVELWLGPALGWDLPNGRVTILGSGDQKLNWISSRDVARVAVQALSAPSARDQVLTFSADYASPNELVTAVEDARGEPLEIQHVPIEQLQAERDGAGDPVSESFAGLRLATALGDEDDHNRALRELVPDPTSVRGFLLEQATQGC